MVVRSGLAGLALLVTTGALVGGCSDARFEEKNRLRWARVDRYVTEARMAESRRPRQLADMNVRTEEAYRARQQKFQKSLKSVDQTIQRDVQRWHQRQAQREARITGQLQGDPANIRETIPELY